MRHQDCSVRRFLTGALVITFSFLHTTYRFVTVSPDVSEQKATAIHRAVLAKSPTLSVAVAMMTGVLVEDRVVPALLPLLVISGVVLVKLTMFVVL